MAIKDHPGSFDEAAEEHVSKIGAPNSQNEPRTIVKRAMKLVKRSPAAER